MSGAAPVHRRVRAAAMVAVLAAVLAGCGSSGVVEGGNNAFSATTLTVYTDLPLLGPDGAEMTNVVNGEELALYEAGGHVGQLHVSIEELDDAASADGISAPVTQSGGRQVANSAHAAASDLSTIAYIGDLDSAATAISLPLNNENGILQISPGSSYSGFTDASAVAPRGGPSVWYLNGQRTFARLVPSDVVEAKATVGYMRSLGVRRLDVLADDENPPYDSGIAALVAADAPTQAIAIAGRQTAIAMQSAAPSDYAKLAAAVASEHPDAVLLGASPGAGAQALARELHARLPHAKLFAPSTLAAPSFLTGLGAAAASTYVTSPILEPGQYPPAAQAVLARYRRLFPGTTPSAYALYGYEAMEDVLRSIRLVGRQAANRSKLIYAFFHRLGRRDSVLGDYTIDAHGDTSLQSFDGYSVGADGSLVLVRRLS
jgi:branched-chain amino acid transport system substrate-binding protein